MSNISIPIHVQPDSNGNLHSVVFKLNGSEYRIMYAYDNSQNILTISVPAFMRLTPTDILNLVAAQFIENLKMQLITQTLNVNIQNASLTVIISGTPNINISSITGGVIFTISGSVTISGTPNINISSITGGVIFNIAGSVTITSGAVTISTSSGINILIDLLTSSAYTSNNVTILNDPSPAGAPANTTTQPDVQGKFFPRGCRGHMQQIGAYLLGNGVDTIVLNVAPQPGMASIYSVTVTPANGVWGWVYGDIKRFWNYDSCFIWCTSSGATVKIGWDTTSPTDYFILSGGLWSGGGYRFYYRLSMRGQTIGDIPVSGTLNVVNLPNIASRGDSGAQSVPNTTMTQLLQILGAGELLEVTLYWSNATAPTAAIFYQGRVNIDGAATNYDFYNYEFTGLETSKAGWTTRGEFWCITNLTVTYLTLRLPKPIQFKKSITISAYQNTGGAVNCAAKVLTNLIE